MFNKWKKSNKEIYRDLMNKVLRPDDSVSNMSLFDNGIASECRERLDSDGFIEVTMEEAEEEKSPV